MLCPATFTSLVGSASEEECGCPQNTYTVQSVATESVATEIADIQWKCNASELSPVWVLQDPVEYEYGYDMVHTNLCSTKYWESWREAHENKHAIDTDDGIHPDYNTDIKLEDTPNCPWLRIDVEVSQYISSFAISAGESDFDIYKIQVQIGDIDAVNANPICGTYTVSEFAYEVPQFDDYGYADGLRYIGNKVSCPSPMLGRYFFITIVYFSGATTCQVNPELDNKVRITAVQINATSWSTRAIGSGLVQACSACPSGTSSVFVSGFKNISNCWCAPGSYYQVSSSLCVSCEPGKFWEAGQCSACPVSTYSSVSGALNCTACPAGTYSDGAGLSVCKGCPVDTYSMTVGASGGGVCMSCPVNALSVTATSTLSGCICNVGSTGPDGGPCAVCVAGKYKSVNGSAECTMCPKNTFSGVGASSCEVCQANATSAAGSVSQAYCYCKSGYAHAVASYTCKICDPGTWNSQLGRTACSNCSLGLYSSNYGATGNETCLSCALGKWSPEGSPNCNLCPANSLAGPRSGSQSDCTCDTGLLFSPGYSGPRGGPCSACSVTVYAVQVVVGSNAVVSTADLQRKYSLMSRRLEALQPLVLELPFELYNVFHFTDAGVGGFYLEMELIDRDGRFLDENQVAQADEVLTWHLADYFYIDASRVHFETMAPRFPLVNNVSNVRVWVDCDADQLAEMLQRASRLRSTQAIAMQRVNISGLYNAVQNMIHGLMVNGTFVQCKPNFIVDALACKCQRGYRLSGDLCVLCQAGTYSNEFDRASACTNCSAGAFSIMPGSTTCTNCTAGAYSAQAGASAACSVCPVEAWSPQGSANCNLCPVHSHRLGIAGSVTDCVCDRGHTGPSGSTCAECAVGFYKNITGPNACTSCPALMSSFSATERVTDCWCVSGYIKVSGACVQMVPRPIQISGTLEGVSGNSSAAQIEDATLALRRSIATQLNVPLELVEVTRAANSSSEVTVLVFARSESEVTLLQRKVTLVTSAPKPTSLPFALLPTGNSSVGEPRVVELTVDVRFESEDPVRQREALFALITKMSEYFNVSAGDITYSFNASAGTETRRVIISVRTASHDEFEWVATTAQALLEQGNVTVPELSVTVLGVDDAGPSGLNFTHALMRKDGSPMSEDEVKSSLPALVRQLSWFYNVPESDVRVVVTANATVCVDVNGTHTCFHPVYTVQVLVMSSATVSTTELQDRFSRMSPTVETPEPLVLELPFELDNIFYCTDTGVDDFCVVMELVHSNGTFLDEDEVVNAGEELTSHLAEFFDVDVSRVHFETIAPRFPMLSNASSVRVWIDTEEDELEQLLRRGSHLTERPTVLVQPYALDGLDNAVPNVIEGQMVDGQFLQCPPNFIVDALVCKCKRGYRLSGELCVPCEAGTYGPGLDMLECLPCGNATFSLQGAASCTSCQANSNSSMSSVSRDACQCHAGFFFDKYLCAPCVNGSFKSTSGNFNCSACPTEYYSSNALSCNTCNYGYAPNGMNSSVCVSCPKGSFKPTPDSSPCLLCATNTFSNATAAPSCEACPVGYRSLSGTIEARDCCAWNSRPLANFSDLQCLCNAGFTGPAIGALKGQCSACPAGTYKASNGTDNCTRCSVGTYSTTFAAESNATCAACAAGQYAPEASTNCTVCPANSAAPARSGFVTNCLCDAAFTGPNGGPCVPCAAGTFKSSTGNASCTACAYGSNSTIGQSVCFCIAGFFANGSVCAPFDGTYLTVNYPLVDFMRACGASQTDRCRMLDSRGSDASFQPGGLFNFNDGNYGTMGGNMCYDANTGDSCVNVDFEKPRLVMWVVVVWQVNPWYEAYKNQDFSVRVGNTPVFYVNGQPSTSFNAGSLNTLMCAPKKPSVDSVLTTDTLYRKFTINCSNALSGRYFTLNKNPLGGISNGPGELQALGYMNAVGAQESFYACNQGYTGPKGGPCTTCAIGTYKDTVSIDVCTACPSNSNSSAKSMNLTACLCNARYTGPNGGPCPACDAGKFKNASGSQACDVCAANTYSASGVSVCTTCLAGFQSAPGSREVADCCDPNTTYVTNLFYSLSSTAQAYLGTIYVVRVSSSPMVGSSVTSANVQPTYIAVDGFNGQPFLRFSKTTALTGHQYLTVGTGQVSVGSGLTIVTVVRFTENMKGVLISMQQQSEFVGFEVSRSNGLQFCVCALTGGNECNNFCTDAAVPTNIWLEVSYTYNPSITNKQLLKVSYVSGGSTVVLTKTSTVTILPLTSPRKHGFGYSAGDCSGNQGWLQPKSELSCDRSNFDLAGFYLIQTLVSDADVTVLLQAIASFSQIAFDRSTNCPCNAGFGGSGRSDCASCAPGTYKSEVKSGSCSLCVANTYSTAVQALNVSTCLACPNNSVSVPGRFECECNFGYQGDMFNCSACVPGKYKRVLGTSACLDCPANTEAPGFATIVCASLPGYNGLGYALDDVGRSCGSGLNAACTTLSNGATSNAVGATDGVLDGNTLTYVSVAFNPNVARSCGAAGTSACAATYAPALTGGASLANDGNTNTVTQTDVSSSVRPYWGVDFGQSRAVFAVKILSTGWTSLQDFKITVGDSADVQSPLNAVCADYLTGAGSGYVTFACEDTVSGRYLFIINGPHVQNYVTLSEVVVESFNYTANPSLMLPWWALDFGVERAVSGLVIQAQAANVVHVRVGHSTDPLQNAICAQNRTVASAVSNNIACSSAMLGRYLFVLGTGNNVLFLNEVRTLGAPAAACAQGTYKPLVGNTNCTACSASSASVTSAAYVSQCSCNPGYLGAWS